MTLYFSIAFLGLGLAFGQQNPFFTPSTPSAPTQQVQDTTKADPAPSLRTAVPTPFLTQILEWQRHLKDGLTQQIKALKKGESGRLGAMAWFLGLCLIYGVVHALGPGHGKSVVVSFFLSRNGSWQKGLAMSLGITILHVLSAVLLLYGLYFLASSSLFPSFESNRVEMERISYLMMMATGLLLLGLFTWDGLRHKHGASEPTSLAQSQASWKEVAWTSFVTGAIPCPAVALVVLFCLLQSMPWVGLAGALAIGVGMGLTHSAFGLGAIALRKGMMGGMARSHFMKKWALALHWTLGITGSLMITALGFVLWSGTK